MLFVCLPYRIQIKFYLILSYLTGRHLNVKRRIQSYPKKTITKSLTNATTNFFSQIQNQNNYISEIYNVSKIQLTC